MHTRNVCRTLEDLPEKNPDNVIGEGDEPDNLVIYWTVSQSLFGFSLKESQIFHLISDFSHVT